MLSRHRLLLAALLFLMVSALSSFAHADSQARIVRLSYVEGDVQLAHQGSGFENATLNVPIVEGDQLRAGSSGWAGSVGRAMNGYAFCSSLARPR